MKKFLSLLLAAVMLLGCIPAMAEDSPEWKINNNSKLVARKSAAEKLESIVVPAEVNGMAVSGVEYMAFNMYKNFKQLTVEDGAFMLDRRPEKISIRTLDAIGLVFDLAWMIFIIAMRGIVPTWIQQEKYRLLYIQAILRVLWLVWLRCLLLQKE